MKKYLSRIFIVLWVAAIAGGAGILLAYQYTPGSSARPPARWPLRSEIRRVPGGATLMMFAHPKCPCTRASIGELALLMAHCKNQTTACVVFFQPEKTGTDWADTDLWKSAQAIPGVTVLADHEGREAACFHVATSGHVVLYDSDGALRFSGGITSSRGHFGDNAGRDDLTRILRHEPADESETPIFGCPLFDSGNSRDGLCRH